MLHLSWLAVAVAMHTGLGISYEQILDQGDSSAGPLCNSTFDQANGTGVLTFNPGFTMATHKGADSANDPIPDASWAITVSEKNGLVWSKFWFNPNGVEYWNDELTQFDACVLGLFPPFPQNTIDLSQDDPGDCSVMITTSCREAIIGRVEAAALRLTTYASPGEYSNLTASSLPSICNDIFNSLQANDRNFPGECTEDFGLEAAFEGPSFNTENEQDLTANSISADWLLPAYGGTNYCPINSTDGKQYYSTLGFASPSQWYDVAMRQATPILTVYFTVANAYARINVASYASAQLNCLRVTNVVEGSRVAPRLPSGTPYPGPGLTPGEIAGVSVGSVAFVGVLAAVGYFLFRRRRKGRALRAEDELDKVDKVEQSSEIHELERKDQAELSPTDRKPEVDGTQVLELKGTEGAAEASSRNPKAEVEGNPIGEIEGTNGAAELDANPRWSFNSSRRSISSYNTAASSI